MLNENYETFKNLCLNLNRHDHLHIPSPSYQKRRAAVAAILRWHSHDRQMTNVDYASIKTIEDFFEQSWVKKDKEGYAELLFMQRASRIGDRWSGHVSFVGGKNEPGETDEETVKREVMEEIGIDLNENYIKVGQLDEREILSIKDNKLLMVLCPFVYLQVVPESPSFLLQASEVADVKWVPLSFFLSSQKYINRPIKEHLSIIRLEHRWVSPLIRFMMGSVTFPAVDLPVTTTDKQAASLFRLWGLTMGMTSDLVKFTQFNDMAFVKLTKSLPIFSRPDIGFLVFWITHVRAWFHLRKTDRKRAQAEWDKVYFSSIRIAVLVAVLLRISFASVSAIFIINKILKSI
ncbi:MAG: NUDIX hydrolase domain-like protein [Benjaminiella poitrasii]|nr:MAG: NUDIX hydrolase domain-like protein [Benjaminiella poitrasii]